MKYLCLVYGEQAVLDGLSKGEFDALVAESLAYDDVLRQNGRYLASDALQPVQTAKTVRVRNRKARVTDGPFAETKEQLLGFILIDAKDMDDAIQSATRIPMASRGSVEVRPIRELKSMLPGT